MDWIGKKEESNMEQNRNTQNDQVAAIGIGAMIVFIALILVAAVASAVIIQTGEKLQQNAQLAADDTQKEISGRIIVDTVLVNDSTAGTIIVLFHVAPGGGVLQADEVQWRIECNDNAGAYAVDSGALDDVGGGAGGDEGVQTQNGVEVSTMSATNYYRLSFGANAAGLANCLFDGTEITVGEQATLTIFVNDGGVTTETLEVQSLDSGAVLI